MDQTRPSEDTHHTIPHAWLQASCGILASARMYPGSTREMLECPRLQIRGGENVFVGGGHTCTFFTIPFANLRGNVVRTFFLGSLISTVPMSSVSRVLFLLCSFNFLQTDGLQTDGRLFRLCEELIFGKGMRTATFQFSESGGSVNGPNLFTQLPFL